MTELWSIQPALLPHTTCHRFNNECLFYSSVNLPLQRLHLLRALYFRVHQSDVFLVNAKFGAREHEEKRHLGRARYKFITERRLGE